MSQASMLAGQTFYSSTTVHHTFLAPPTCGPWKSERKRCSRKSIRIRHYVKEIFKHMSFTEAVQVKKCITHFTSMNMLNEYV